MSGVACTRTHIHTRITFKTVYQKHTKCTNMVNSSNMEGNLSARERLLINKNFMKIVRNEHTHTTNKQGSSFNNQHILDALPSTLRK